jgi:hypothetical protein
MDPAQPAPTPSKPPSPAAFGFDWPNAILLAATACLLAVVAGAVAQLVSGHRDGTWLMLAMFMACFSVFKLMVAIRAVREVRLVPQGGIDPREHFGTAGRFWAWVGLKVVVSIVAMGAAAIIVLHGPGALR